MGKKRCGDDLLLLPDDFLIKILVWLPVKSLLRFKTVSKSWRQLIETPFFIDLHTTTTTTSNKFGAFILQPIKHSPKKYEDDIKLYMLSSSGSGDHGDHGDDDQKKKKKMVFNVDDLGFLPFYYDFLLGDALRMVGSCNGIICLHDPEVMDDHRGRTRQNYSNLRDVYLWNPAIRQFRILPKSIPIEEKPCYMENWLEDFISLGYDVKTKDYKVLRITSFRVSDRKGCGCMGRVQVYSLSTDSWRLLDDINYLPVARVPNHGIYLNGCYFFVGKKIKIHGGGGGILLSFDFTKEIFTTMQLPDGNWSSRQELVLSSLGEKLAVFATIGIDDCDGGGYKYYYDIWVLNEQQGISGGQGDVNNESWTKLHSFQIKNSRGLSSHTGLRCISNNGEFALISTGRINNGYPRNKLQLFNLVTKEAEKDFVIGIRECRADVYKESLVSIMGGGNNVLLKWQLPTYGTTYKLNLDAPFIDSYASFGIGLCLTTDTGGCIGVRSLQRSNVRDAEQGEALAMLEAIKWAKKLELSPIIIESDSKKCVSSFMEDDDDDNNLTNWSSGAASLLEEAKLLLKNSSELGRSISFQYCSRSCNYVTDIAAKLGREMVCMDWTAKFPGEMVRSLSKDLGLETEEGRASLTFDLETSEGWSSEGWSSDSSLKSDSGLESDDGWSSDSSLKSDSGLESDDGWASDSGIESEEGSASE